MGLLDFYRKEEPDPRLSEELLNALLAGRPGLPAVPPEPDIVDRVLGGPAQFKMPSIIPHPRERDPTATPEDLRTFPAPPPGGAFADLLSRPTTSPLPDPNAEVGRIVFDEKGPPRTETPRVAHAQEGMEQEIPIEEKLAGLTDEEREAEEPPEFGPGLQERFQRAKGREEETSYWVDMATALGRMGDMTSANQILLGLERVGAPELPESLQRELKVRQLRRLDLEGKIDEPEYNPKSPISAASRRALESLIGQKIPDSVSAAQIKEQFGDAGGLFVQGEKLKMAREAHGRLPNEVVGRLGRGRYALKKLRNLEKAYGEVEPHLGPIYTRMQKLGKLVGWDRPEATRVISESRDVFAKYLYGTSGKQLSNKEIAFMAETFFDATNSAATFKELLQSVRQRMLEEYNTELEQEAANGRNIEMHILPGWSQRFTPDGKIEIIHGQQKRVIRVPRGTSKSVIDDIKKRGFEVEIVDQASDREREAQGA